MFNPILKSGVSFQGDCIVKSLDKKEFDDKVKHLTLQEQTYLNKTISEIRDITINNLNKNDVVEISLESPPEEASRFHPHVPRFVMKFTPDEETKKLDVAPFVKKEFLQNILSNDFGLKTLKNIADKVLAVKQPLYEHFKKD